MKQIDWVTELEEKKAEEKRIYDKQPWWKKTDKKKLQIFDFKCDHCMRTIIVQYKAKPDHPESLVCLCGRDYTINAEIVDKWIKDEWNREIG